jgi:hypothetical protein
LEQQSFDGTGKSQGSAVIKLQFYKCKDFMGNGKSAAMASALQENYSGVPFAPFNVTQKI